MVKLGGWLTALSLPCCQARSASHVEQRPRVFVAPVAAHPQQQGTGSPWFTMVKSTLQHACFNWIKMLQPWSSTERFDLVQLYLLGAPCLEELGWARWSLHVAAWEAPPLQLLQLTIFTESSHLGKLTPRPIGCQGPIILQESGLSKVQILKGKRSINWNQRPRQL